MDPGSLEFLKGGGEMGARMRALDWVATPLGSPRQWPQSLKTIVRVMLDSRFAMWMMWGEAGTFFCNDAYLPTVGVKREWVLGARADKVWEEIWSDIWPRIDHVLRTGEATFDEGLRLFLRRSGYDEETFHTFSYSPIYDDQDRIAGMLCVVVEETTRVIGERRLRTLRELAALSTNEAASVDAAGRQMLALLPSNGMDIAFAALYQVDAGTRVARLVDCNTPCVSGRLPISVDIDTSAAGQAIARAIGTRQEQLIEGLAAGGVGIADHWGALVQQAVVVPLAGVGRSRITGALVLGVSTRRRLDPAYHGFLSLVADQVATGLSDARSRLEERERAQALAELDRAKNVFFGNVSHEFRTPLTLMLGPVDDLLARPALDTDIVESLRLVQRNGLRLRKLVNSLLDFSRIEAGRVDAHYKPTDLTAFTLDLVSVFRSAVEQAGLRLEVRCAPMPEPVYVDRDMWEKVVLNLLSNAFKFTLEGEIEVVLAVEGSEAHLGVRDTGAGIDERDLPNVFDRFHRVAGTRARSQEGTGIGLALVQELVRLHGGTVSVKSQLGKGSSFTVTIPLGSAHLPQDRIEAAGTPAVSSLDSSSFVDDALRAGPAGSLRQTARAVRASPGVVREHILVVDDNADMRSYVERLLLPYWDVTTASDGRQALDAIEQALPDLVVTDMNMPNLDGRALIQHIRTRRESHALPVIVLSAQAGEEQRVAGLNQGADDYLVKPFSARELLARVEVQLLRARMRVADEGRNADSLLWSKMPPADPNADDGAYRAGAPHNGGSPPG